MQNEEQIKEPIKEGHVAGHVIKWVLILGLLAFACVKNREFMEDSVECLKKTPLAVCVTIFLLGNAYVLMAGWVNAIMTRTGERRISVPQGIFCEYMCSFYRLATLGSGGGIAQVYYYYTKGIPVSKGLGMAVCQYTFHKIAIALYGVIGFFVVFFMRPDVVSSYRWFMLAGIAVITAICAFLIVIMVSKRFSDLVFRIGYRLAKKSKRLTEKLKSAEESVSSMQDQGRLIWGKKGMFFELLVVNMVKQTCWYVIPGVILAWNYGTDIFLAMFLMAVANMIGCVMVAPSGIGTLEFCFVLLFGKIVGEGEVIAATLILYRTVTWLIPFLMGLPCALLFKKPKSDSSQSASRSV